MVVAFTICSNNYLAKARITAETFLSHHQDYTFLIFLVDQFSTQIDYNQVPGVKITPIADVVPDVQALAKKYNIIELNTAVKPGLFTYVFSEYKPDHIIYVDPDLTVFDRFTEIEELFQDEAINIIVTPHFCSPIDDGKVPSEIHLSIYGLYNLGFLAVKGSPESQKFLAWWHDRLKKYCYIDPNNGMFTDQLWVNHAPIYFNGVYILKHLGYNVANWNLYERDIDQVEDETYVIGDQKLKFFHFSHYKFADPYLISSQQNRHHIDDFKYMRKIIDQYQNRLITHEHQFLSTIPCYYQQLYDAHNMALNKPDKSVRNVLRKIKNKTISVSKRLLESVG